MKMKKRGLIISTILLAVFITGCAGFLNPAGFFKADPEIKKFLEQYPDADFTLTHYSPEESSSEFANIQKICGKELKAGKELYKAEIKDSASGLSVIAYFDMENQLMECVRKFGTEGKAEDKTGDEDPCKCPGETKGGHDYCNRKFGSLDDGFPNACDCSNGKCECANCKEAKRTGDGSTATTLPTKTPTIPVSVTQPSPRATDKCKCPGETIGGHNYCQNKFGEYLPDGTVNVCECDAGKCECLSCTEAKRRGEKPEEKTDFKCPGSIQISYEKDYYEVGETIAMSFKVSDQEGSPMTKQEVYTLAYQDGKALAEEKFKTDSYGTFSAKKQLDEGDIGIYEQVAFIKQPNCPYVSAVNHFSVHSVSGGALGCCDVPPTGCAVPTSKSRCLQLKGTFYDKSQYPSYTCVQVDKTPPTSRCRPVTGQDQIRNCAAKIDLVFDREAYKVDDYININVIAFDKAYNRLPNKEFKVTATKNGANLGEETHKTDEKGFYYTGSTLDENSVGEYVYRAYIKEEGCEYVVDSAVITISAKLDSKLQPITPTSSPKTDDSKSLACPAKIDLRFNKQSFVTGDNIQTTVDIFNANGQRLPNMEFKVTATKNGVNLGEETHYTDYNGYYLEDGYLSLDNVGEYMYSVFVSYPGCEKTFGDSEQITVSAKLDSGSGTGSTTPSTSPATTPSTAVCASKIYFAYDKQAYVVGDTVTMKVAIYGPKDSVLYGKKFVLVQQKFGEEKNSAPMETDKETGVFSISGVVEDQAVGEYEYEAIVEDAGCPRLSAKQHFTISAKQDSSTNNTKLG